MLLVHDGKLHYDDHLTDIFPEFPAYGKAITIRNLLNHTSGLPDYEDLLMEQYPDTPEDKIPQILDAGVCSCWSSRQRQVFRPAPKWEYSNSGYAVLAMIVEKVSGKPFGQFLQERIFTPAEDEQHAGVREGQERSPAPRLWPHAKKKTAGAKPIRARPRQFLAMAESTPRSTILAKWDRALREHTLLSEAEMRPALTPVQPTAGPAKFPNGKTVSYGFGWFLDPYKGHKRMSHDGETIGFLTTIQRFPGR